MSSDLDPLLKRLHLANARRVWRDLVRRAEADEWSYEQLLLTVFAEEVAHRRGTRLTRAVRRAGFPFLRTVEEFDFSYQSTLRLTTIGSLLSPDFVTGGNSVILEGKTGRGKTHLAIAIAYRAMQNGFEAVFANCAELIEELSCASREGQLRDAVARYVKPNVLVVDEVGLSTKPISPSGMPRRRFLQLSAVGAGATGTLATSTALAAGAESGAPTRRGRRSTNGKRYDGIYRGECLNRVAFPLGGIGAGMICLEGSGPLSHFSLRHRPEVFHEPCTFAALAIRGRHDAARVLEGPVPGWKFFGTPGTGNGAAGSSFGLPRFREAAFRVRFPFGTVALSDPAVPIRVEIVEEGAPRPKIFDWYESQIGVITPMIADELKQAEADYSSDWIEAAFREAARSGALSWRYIDTVLKRWQVLGHIDLSGNSKQKGGKNGQTGTVAVDDSLIKFLRQDN